MKNESNQPDPEMNGRNRGGQGTGKQSGGKQPLVSPAALLIIAVLLLFIAILYYIDPEGISRTLKFAGGLFMGIIPVLLVVVVFMAAANMVPLSFLKKHLGSRSGVKGLLIAVLAGTFSHGPAYAWYPFLADLREKGVSNGKIAAFLYARAVKIPLLAAMAFYFGLSFTIIFSALILVASFFLGKMFELMS